MSRIAFYHLETLLWIARLGTFSAAAERLNASQPTVTARIRELEAHLGISLFRRNGRTMALTVQGRDIVRQAEELWASFERMAPNPAALTGTVKMGAGEIAASTVLPDYLARVQSGFPRVSLEIEIELTAHLLHGLTTSRFDIVFVPGPVDGSEVRVMSIGMVDMIWVASPGTAAWLPADAGPEECDMPLWIMPSLSPLNDLIGDVIHASRRRGQMIHSCSNAQALLAIIEQGEGIAIAPRSIAEPAIARGALVRIFETSLMPPLRLSAAIRTDEQDAAVLLLFEQARSLSLR